MRKGWGDVGRDFSPFEFRVDSRLVVMRGQEGEEAPLGTSFYVLERGALKKIAFVLGRHPDVWPPEPEEPDEPEAANTPQPQNPPR